MMSTGMFFAPVAWANDDRMRIVSLDWAMTETLLALDAELVGAAALADFKIVTGATPPPESVLDLGSWNEPNLELIQQIKPDVAVLQLWQRALQPILETICRVEITTIYTRKDSPYQRACAETSRLAAKIGRVGETLVRAVDDELAMLRDRLKIYDGRPVIVVKVIDETNLIAFSRNGLFHDVLGRLGLENGWTLAPDLLCGATRISAAALADYPDQRLAIIDSPGRGSGNALYQSMLWSKLPAVVAGRVVHIPPLWEFGALPTARRFARSLSDVLLANEG
jgi:iron complex transport system substrate-binding protein